MSNELTSMFLIYLCINTDSALHQDEISSGVALPLVLILGYINGFHVWTIPVSVNYLGALEQVFQLTILDVNL